MRRGDAAIGGASRHSDRRCGGVAWHRPSAGERQHHARPPAVSPCSSVAAPQWRVAIERTMARPRPVPRVARLRRLAAHEGLEQPLRLCRGHARPGIVDADCRLPSMVSQPTVPRSPFSSRLANNRRSPPASPRTKMRGPGISVTGAPASAMSPARLSSRLPGSSRVAGWVSASSRAKTRVAQHGAHLLDVHRGARAVLRAGLRCERRSAPVRAPDHAPCLPGSRCAPREGWRGARAWWAPHGPVAHLAVAAGEGRQPRAGARVVGGIGELAVISSGGPRP